MKSPLRFFAVIVMLVGSTVAFGQGKGIDTQGQRITDELSAAREHHETERMEEIAGTDSTGAVKAASRNVVGKGIIPVPAAHDNDGKPLEKVNARLQRLFWQWANKAKHCDVERRPIDAGLAARHDALGHITSPSGGTP